VREVELTAAFAKDQNGKFVKAEHGEVGKCSEEL